MHVYVYVCVYACMRMFVCVCLCVRTCVSVCVCVYMSESRYMTYVETAEEN